MDCIHMHITPILKAWFACGGRDLLVFWSKTQCYKMGVFSLTSVVSGIFFFFLSNLNFIKEQKLFLSQWVWQGHLVGEQHFCSPALGIISRSCVWAAQRHPFTLAESGSCWALAPVCIAISIHPSGLLRLGIGKRTLFRVPLLLWVFVTQAQMQ